MDSYVIKWRTPGPLPYLKEIDKSGPRWWGYWTHARSEAMRFETETAALDYMTGKDGTFWAPSDVRMVRLIRRRRVA